MNVESNLKALLDERGESIRGFAERSGLHYESVRRMYNNVTTNYNRQMLARICELLDVEIGDVLLLHK